MAHINESTMYHHDRAARVRYFQQYTNATSVKKFILHYVCETERQNKDVMECRLYFISFLMSNGEEDKKWSKTLIAGKNMN